MKKLTSMLLAALLVLSCLGGLTALAEEEPVTIRWAFSNYSAHENADTSSGVYALINEKYNVNIVPFTTNYLQNAEQFSMLMASGDIPDVWYDWNWQTWYEQGLVRTLDMSVYQEYMPYVWEHVVLELDPELTALKQRTVEDGTVIGFPSYGGTSTPFFRMYRQDWLDALGMEVPVTLEDFKAYVQAVAENDPDGNGADDTYAFYLSVNNMGPGDVMGAFGLPTDFGYMLDAEGKVVYAPASQQYKEFLRLMAEWYAAGYIAPESATMDTDAARQFFASGKFGSWYTNAFNHDWTYENSAEYMLRANDADVEFTPGDAITGANGEQGAYSFTYDSGWSLMFGLNTTDAVIEKVLTILNDLATPEGYLLQWGEEGKDFEFVDGKVTTLLSGEDAYTIGQAVFPRYDGPEVLNYIAGNGAYYDLLVFSMDQPMSLSVIDGYTLSESEEMGYGANLSSIQEEYYWNVIMGAKDLDESWDAYIAELEADGLRELEAEAQRIYDGL